MLPYSQILRIICIHKNCVILLNQSDMYYLYKKFDINNWRKNALIASSTRHIYLFLT